jgi:type II secretory pathway pseudopilin PulG
MVEMMTVVAIMAILAAIIFPIMMPLRRNLAKSSCLTNLRTIAQAVKIYKEDYRIYPEALYGYAPLDQNGNLKPRLVPDPTNPDKLVQVVDTATGKPVFEQRTFLYPQYIGDRTALRCPMNPERSTDTTDPLKLAVGVNGVTGQALDVQPAIQRYGRKYYRWDSYDGRVVPVSGDPNQDQYRVHYLRRWDPPAPGKAESLRQLIFRYPPDATVVTWCTYHRDFGPGGSLNTGSMDLVLFLDGRAKAVPSNLMVIRSDQDVRLQTDAPAHQVAPGT